MKLDEILNRKVQQEVVRDNDDMYMTKAKIGDRLIHFSAELDDPDEDEWAIVFWQTNLNGNNMKFDATGAGSELEVFSMVKDAMLDFVKKRNPKKIHFSAAKNKGEESRSSLYDRLVKKFKLPNYEFEKETGENDDYFYLIRQN